MQLPFVLESAEAMKAAIARIEPHLPKDAATTKGRILIATVKGDVHDIGKNLVDIILSNNGFEVKNLGIKQPIEKILEELEAWPADAIGLSGLLVKSTVIMRENLQLMAERGLKIPVILGGAALTRDYVEGDCRAIYGGPVLYAEDAFEGLRHMKALGGGEAPVPAARPAEPVESTADAPSGITILKRGASAVTLTEAGQSGWVRRSPELPIPPFWGVREFRPSIEELFEFLDTFVVIRNRWGFTQGTQSDEAFGSVLRDKAEPQLAAWKARLIGEPILQPRSLYGYFPACADGDGLKVYAFEGRDEITRIPFPRQASGRRLCIADFFEPESAGRLDVLPLQVVTLGHEAADFAARLYAEHRFAEYFAFHGLATELTEAFAELLHARIRKELGIHGRDAANLRQLFSQGYQGSRYSFGYPACPDLEGNAPLLDLLGGPAIGVELTESFQMTPEYTTSALVAWHPQARYFAV
jgi:5-methyltetrahydrofolate--homocysteine methyltransferase